MGPIGVGSDLQTLHCLFRTTFSLRCPCIELRPPVLTPYPLATIPIIAFETNHEVWETVASRGHPRLVRVLSRLQISQKNHLVPCC